MHLSKREFQKLPKAEQRRLQVAKGGSLSKQQKKKKNNNAHALNPPKRGKSVAVASAYSSAFVGKAASVQQAGNFCRVKHRELLTSITGSAAFTIPNTFALNPGIPATFPWLSSIAQSWEEYEFNQLRFCFHTRTGTNIPGSLMLAPDYDAADAAPADEASASTYQDCIEDAPWKDITCILKKSSMMSQGSRSRKFIRAGDLAANLDIKTYDVGNLFVITTDGTAVGWGKLWVEYDVTFYVPQLPAGVGLAQGGKFIGGTAQTGANPFGTAPTSDAQNQGIAINSASVVTFTKPGDYTVVWNIVGSVISAMSVVLGAGLSSQTAAVTVIELLGGLGGMYRIAIRVANPISLLNPTTLTFSATATTVTTSILLIGQGPASSYA